MALDVVMVDELVIVDDDITDLVTASE